MKRARWRRLIEKRVSASGVSRVANHCVLQMSIERLLSQMLVEAWVKVCQVTGNRCLKRFSFGFFYSLYSLWHVLMFLSDDDVRIFWSCVILIMVVL